MDKERVTEALRALATGDKSRSETARLRDVYPEIERALAAGVTRAKILEELHQRGFSMTLKSFESALYRIRSKRRSKGDQVPATTLPAATPRGGETDAPPPLIEPTSPEPDPATPPRTGPIPTRQERDARAKEFIPDDDAPSRRRRFTKPDQENNE